MVLVILRRDPRSVRNNMLEKLLSVLPSAISICLSTDSISGNVQPKDVVIITENFGPHDISRANFQLFIFANSCPERERNLDFRRDELIKRLEEHLPKSVTGFIWISLCRDSFGMLWR